MTEKYNFDSVAERLANIDQEVLKEISRCMADGEKAKPMSKQEKACFDILEDVDHIGSHVNGSITNKHYMPMQSGCFCASNMHHHGALHYPQLTTSILYAATLQTKTLLLIL